MGATKIGANTSDPQMNSGITDDPRDRLGIFKHLNDVPENLRLSTYSPEYEGRDTYGEFLVQELFPQYNSYQTKQQSRLAGRRWKEHMGGCGRHHALATPGDVETWCETILEDVNQTTAYKTYWAKLEAFYDWLLWRTDHPHAYNPVLMAAAHGDAAGAIWARKMELREE